MRRNEVHLRTSWPSVNKIAWINAGRPKVGELQPEIYLHAPDGDGKWETSSYGKCAGEDVIEGGILFKVNTDPVPAQVDGVPIEHSGGPFPFARLPPCGLREVGYADGRQCVPLDGRETLAQGNEILGISPYGFGELAGTVECGAIANSDSEAVRWMERRERVKPRENVGRNFPGQFLGRQGEE